MKKVILSAQLPLTQKELEILNQDMQKQWDDGFMLIPNNFKVQLVDEDWTAVESGTPPKGQVVLIWMEYEDGEHLGQTYGFGKFDGDGWIVYLQQAKRILAWMTLPDPFKV